MTFTPRVTVVEPGQRLEWLGTMGIPQLREAALKHFATAPPPLADDLGPMLWNKDIGAGDYEGARGYQAAIQWVAPEPSATSD